MECINEVINSPSEMYIAVKNSANDLGISIRRLCVISGVNISTVYKWKNSKTLPSRNTLIYLQTGIKNYKKIS